MRRHASRFVLCLAAASLLSACNQPNGMPNAGILNGGGPNKQDIGTLLGAAGGGLLGNQIGGGSGRAVATVGGVLLGGLLGNQIGKSLDNADRAMAEQNAQRALETGQPGQAFPWSNPQSGNSGVVIPSNYYQTASGQYCREYQQRIVVGGQVQHAYGTACRQPDGSWQIVK